MSNEASQLQSSPHTNHIDGIFKIIAFIAIVGYLAGKINTPTKETYPEPIEIVNQQPLTTYKTIRKYYSALNKRDVIIASNLRETTPSNFQESVKNVQFAKINEMRIEETDANNASAYVNVTVQTYNEHPQQWQGTIKLHKSESNNWLISSLSLNNATQQPVITHETIVKDHANKITDQPKETIQEAIAKTQRQELQRQREAAEAKRRVNNTVKVGSENLIPLANNNSATWFRVINIPEWDTLNMRTKASTRSPTIYKIPFNKDCILGTEETQLYLNKVWRKIIFNNRTGWVNSKFLGATNGVCTVE